MNKKTGVHVYSTAPSKERGESFSGLNQLETLTLLQSITSWNKHNGPMILMADAPFIDFIERIGLKDLYSDVIELPPLENINESVFWAASKMQAIKMMGVGYYFVDIDLILDAPLPDTEASLVIAHDDYLSLPTGEKYHWQFKPFSNPPEYITPHWLRQEANDWLGYPKSLITGTSYSMFGFNTSLFMSTDQGFIDEYITAAFDWMTGNPCLDLQSGWAMMVWAEQVMLRDLVLERQTKFIQARDYLREDFSHLQDLKRFYKKNTEEYISGTINQLVLNILIPNGYVYDDHCGPHCFKITDKGLIATHLQEVHPLAIADIYMKTDGFSEFTARELASIFSCFTNLNVPEDLKTLSPNAHSYPINKITMEIIKSLDYYEKLETTQQIDSGSSYEINFDIQTEILDWCSCETEEECKKIIESIKLNKNI